jgi:hypothetical protein
MKTMLSLIVVTVLLSGCGKEQTPGIVVVPLVCAADEIMVPEPSGWGSRCVLKDPPTMVCTGSGWTRECHEEAP